MKPKERKSKEKKAKHVESGQEIPAVVIGFCGICGIKFKEENRKTMELLQVPEVFDYTLAGVFEALDKSFERRNE